MSDADSIKGIDKILKNDIMYWRGDFLKKASAQAVRGKMQNCKRRENYEKEKPISCADAGNSSVHVNGCMRKQRRRQ